VRLPDEYGTDEFWNAYRAAMAGPAPPAPGKAKGGTLRWLLEEYRRSSEWASLANATRRQRENIYKHVMEGAGSEPFADIDRATIAAGRDRRKDTPAAARNFLEAMRGLFRWALETGHVAADPTAGIKSAKLRTDGFHAWTEAEIAQYEARWPLGTRERLAFDVLLYTGLRRGDAVRAGPAMVAGGILSIRTEKTGRDLSLPILAALRASLEAGPIGTSTWIAGERRKPLTKESFGTWFKIACKAAGLPHCSAHGLRKAGATRAANSGATVAQLEAIFGWDGGGMASLYTRKADRERLAREAMDKLEKR